MKTVIITGGAGYLGSVLVKALAGYNCIMFDGDITDAQAVNKFVHRLPKNIFGVIHAASAPLIRKPVLEITPKEFESQFLVNVTGAFFLLKTLLPLMIPGGCIVGVTTKALDNQGHSPSGSYIPAKFALRGLLRILSEELKSKSIRVYEIAPAFMPGGLNKDIPRPVMDFIKSKSKPQDITTPERVAQEILSLIE